MVDTIQGTSAQTQEMAAASTAALEAGEQSLQDDAEALGLGEEDHKTVKITAAQVEKDCPVILQDLGKRIAAHLEKARKCEEKAEQHYTSVAKHLANAKQACDEEGFTAFREKFCPKMSQSRAYELLSIANNKKSVEEIRAATRARVARHRANKAADSVTVTEATEPAHEALTPVGGGGAINTASEQRPKSAELPGAVAPNDGALNHFSEIIVELVGRTRKCKPEHFVEAAVCADDLAELGKFLTDLAGLKNSQAKRTIQGDGAVSAEQSAEDMKAKYAALEAVDRGRRGRGRSAGC
jgi:hypothetical protein